MPTLSLGRSLHSNDTEGDCIVIEKYNLEHVGWVRTNCETTKAPFICQLGIELCIKSVLIYVTSYFLHFSGQTLSTFYQPYVSPPKVLLPLDKDSGPKVFTYISVISVETNVAYDTKWVPSYLTGSPTFSKFFEGNSYIDVDLTEVFPVPLKKMTLVMWIMPFSLKHRPVFVS